MEEYQLLEQVSQSLPMTEQLKYKETKINSITKFIVVQYMDIRQD